MFKIIFNNIYPFWWTFDLFFHPTPSFSVICASDHLVTECGFNFLSIMLEIKIPEIMGACYMQPTIFTDFFLFTWFIIGSGIGRVCLWCFTSSWRDLISSNICNCTLSFSWIVALETWSTIGAGGGMYYWSVWFGEIISSARDTSCCTFCTFGRNWPDM